MPSPRPLRRKLLRSGLAAAAALLLACAGDDVGRDADASATEPLTGASSSSAADTEATASTTATTTTATTDPSETASSTTDATTSDATTSDTTTSDATTSDGTTGEDACAGAEPPLPLEACGPGSCWSTLTFSAYCGATAIIEDFSSGNYNVHDFAIAIRGGVAAELTLTRTGGDFEPALVLRDAEDVTLYDGEFGVCDGSLMIEPLATGEGRDAARVRITAADDLDLRVLVTGWHVVDGGFTPEMPQDATYGFEVAHACAAATGAADPPNFDEDDLDGGYYLLPDSEPAGLYTHKHDDCSRGTRRLIQVLTTVAARWSELRPELAPISFLDLNEAWCSNVDHATHDDGTHADLTAGCATDTGCADWIPALDLARLLLDTGEVCGILFNDATVQAQVNPIFEMNHDYQPWKGTMMRSVDGHEHHFHVRVKKLDGTCN